MKTRLRNLQALSHFKSELCSARSYELGGDCEEESLEERREIGRFQAKEIVISEIDLELLERAEEVDEGAEKEEHRLSRPGAGQEIFD